MQQAQCRPRQIPSFDLSTIGETQKLAFTGARIVKTMVHIGRLT